MPLHPVLLNALILVAVFLLANWSFANNSLMGKAALVGVPLLLMVFPKRNILFLLAVIFSQSQVFIPGFPSALNLSCLLFLLAVLSAFSSVLLKKTAMQRPAVTDVLLLVYAAWIALHFVVRGFGLRILGSQVWGGGDAIALYMYMALFMFRRYFVLDTKQWIRAFALLMVFSAAPMVADLVYIMTSGEIAQHFAFIGFTPGSLAGGMLASNAGRVWRLQRTIFFVPFLLGWILWLWKAKHVKTPVIAIMMLPALFMLAISGHRISAVTFIMILFFFRVLEIKRLVVRRASSFLLLLLVVWALIIPTARFLPLAAQRVVSFLPLVEVRDSVRRDAVNTIAWRVEVWKANMQDIPKYFWIGKGLLIRQEEIMAFYARQRLHRMLGIYKEDYELSRWNRDYHNGPLALLLDTGIFGLVLAALLMILVCHREVIAALNEEWNSNELMWLHRVFLSMLLAQTTTFWLIYGDMRFIPQLFLFGTILYALRHSDAVLAEQRDQESAVKDVMQVSELNPS